MFAAWTLRFTGKDLHEVSLKAFAFWRDNHDWLGQSAEEFFAACGANAAGTRLTYRERAAARGKRKVARAGRGRLAKPRLAIGHTGSIPVPSAIPLALGP